MRVIARKRQIENRIRHYKAVIKNIEETQNEVFGAGDVEDIKACREALHRMANAQEYLKRALAKYEMGYFSRVWWALKGGY